MSNREGAGNANTRWAVFEGGFQLTFNLNNGTINHTISLPAFSDGGYRSQADSGAYRFDYGKWVWWGFNVSTGRVDAWIGGETNVYGADGVTSYRPKPLNIVTSMYANFVCAAPVAGSVLLGKLRATDDICYKGQIGTPVIFPRLLTNAEITNLYNSTILGKTSWKNNLPIPRAE
jgi:hypothetical protein